MSLRWRPIIQDFPVPARPTGVWTMVLPYVEASAVIRIEAAGLWRYDANEDSDEGPCGPDGRRISYVNRANCICKDALVGALVAKIGGGSSDCGGTPIPVGGFAVIHLDDKTSGPLFLTINDEIQGMDGNSDELKVQVFLKG